MQCPVCDDRLREIEKYGVLVDICPSCKGVWLDRGELEKLASLEARDGHNQPSRDRQDDRHDDHRRDDGSRGEHGYGRPKRRSFLSDLMEGLGD